MCYIRSICGLTGQRQGAVVLGQGEVQFCQHSELLPVDISFRTLRTTPALVGRATSSARATLARMKWSGGISQWFRNGISRVFCSYSAAAMGWKRDDLRMRICFPSKTCGGAGSNPKNDTNWNMIRTRYDTETKKPGKKQKQKCSVISPANSEWLKLQHCPMTIQQRCTCENRDRREREEVEIGERGGGG